MNLNIEGNPKLLEIYKSRYITNDALAILIELEYETGEIDRIPISLNLVLDTHKLGPNEFFLKDYSECIEIARELKRLELIIEQTHDSGEPRFAVAGFEFVCIYKLTPLGESVCSELGPHK